MLDRLKTEFQETGECRVATLSLGEIGDILVSLGMEPNDCFIDVAGFMYVRRAPVTAS